MSATNRTSERTRRPPGPVCALVDRARDVAEQIRATAPRGTDVALDVVAAGSVSEGLPLLREGGRWVIAVGDGRPAGVPMELGCNSGATGLRGQAGTMGAARTEPTVIVPSAGWGVRVPRGHHHGLDLVRQARPRLPLRQLPPERPQSDLVSTPSPLLMLLGPVSPHWGPANSGDESSRTGRVGYTRSNSTSVLSQPAASWRRVSRSARSTVSDQRSLVLTQSDR